MVTCLCALVREEGIRIHFDSLFHDMSRNLDASWQCNKGATTTNTTGAICKILNLSPPLLIYIWNLLLCYFKKIKA
jgi:hypothetical protein